MDAEQPAAAERRGAISLDALILIMVTGLTLHLDSYNKVLYTTPSLNALAVGLLGFYLALDVLGRPLLDGAPRARRLFYGGKGVILAGIITLMLLWPTVNMIGMRHASHPWQYVHDTSINVEAATNFLLQGKNPYTQQYFHTALVKFGWYSGPKYGYGPNPALWWTDTFPGQELLTVPFMLASQATLGWFDERFIYIAAFFVTVALLLRLAPTPATRLALVAGVALNPMWVPEFIYGQNDILILAELLVVLWLSTERRWRLALLALGIACATKQTTLLLVPFYLWWLAQRLGATWPQRLERLALLVPWLIVPLVLMAGPFAAWNWRAFYDGNFGYVAGTVPHSYPIQGYDAWGAASFILWSGLVRGPNAYYPFSVLEAAAAIPLALVLVRRMRATTPATVMLAAYATVLFAIFYFSRFFHQSYLAFTTDLFLVAYLAHRPARERADDGHLSFDLLVPLLLIPQLIPTPGNRASGIVASLVCGLLLAYMVVAVLTPWSRLRAPGPRRLAAAARAIVLAGLAEVALFAPSVSSIADRLRWNAPATFIHDTALQIQISAGELLKLHNPYTTSFLQTPLLPLFVPSFHKGRIADNLPLTNNAHLPLGFLLGAAPQAFFNRIHMLFDERYIYLLALLVTIVVLAALARVPARQLALIGAVLFSPLFGSVLILGQDDVLVLMALAVGLLLLQRGHALTASFALGVAIAFKVTAWPLAPLLLAYLAGRDRGLALRWPRRIGRVVLRSVGLGFPLLASALPFVLWNARAIFQDVIAYPLGLERNAIPLDITWKQGFQTLGFSRVALHLGWARLNGDGYIGVWLAVLLGALILAILVVRLWRSPNLSLLVAGYLVLLFTAEYFGRFMVDNSLGYLAVVAPLAFFLAPPRPVAQATPIPLPASTSGDGEAAVAV